jgi:hypothetical protein
MIKRSVARGSPTCATILTCALATVALTTPAMSQPAKSGSELAKPDSEGSSPTKNGVQSFIWDPTVPGSEGPPPGWKPFEPVAAPGIAPGAPAGYQLAYSDEFSGPTLNRADWYFRISDGPTRMGFMQAANVTVLDGNVRLRYDIEPVSGYPGLQYTGGGIISRARFGYGYFETRARLYKGTTGAHTSFWSLGLLGDDVNSADLEIQKDIAAGNLPARGDIIEIDGFEHDSPDLMDMGTAKKTYDGIRCRDSMGGYKTGAQRGIDYSQWNVYGYEYTPTDVSFYINRRLVRRFSLADCPSPHGLMNFWLTSLPFRHAKDYGAFPGYSDFTYFRYYNRPHLNVNLLGNGSFDLTPLRPPPDAIPLGWQEAGNADASTMTTEDKQDGTRSLEHKWIAAYRVSTKQDLRYIPNGTYRLSAYVKSSGGQADARMRVYNTGAAEQSLAIPKTDRWTQLVIDNIVVTSGKASIDFTSDAPADAWMKFDNVVFVQTK